MQIWENITPLPAPPIGRWRPQTVQRGSFLKWAIPVLGSPIKDEPSEVNLAIFTHILPAKLVGRFAKYLEFKQMISGQGFCTILAVNYDKDELLIESI